MHIGIDARLYGVQSGTGIGRYVEDLIRALALIDQTNTYTVFLRRDGFDAFAPPNARWRKLLADFRPYTFCVQSEYPRLVRESGVDLMHFTHFDHPLRCPVPFVVTIHDLILLSHPSIRASTLGPLRFWAKYLAYRAIIRHAVRSSVAICTPSESVRSEITRRFGIRREKIATTLLGMDHAASFQPSESHERVEKSRSIGDLSAPEAHPPLAETLPHSFVRDDEMVSGYVLYIGNAYPHKNLEQIIRIWPSVRRIHPDLHLVLIGREDDFSRRLHALPHDDHVIFHGAMDELELRATIANAFAYVSPSKNEGFDLPTVEAAAAGAPVIASDIPVHKEILGDAAVFFAPEDDAGLIHAIDRIAVDSELRDILKARGRERAERYTWRSCAARTFEVYSHASTSRRHEEAEVEHAQRR